MPKAFVNGISMYYETHGRGDPLVLLIGLGAGHLGWFFQVPVFKRQYRVVILDNRGAGKTDKPSQPYTIRTMADDTVGLMDHLGIEKAHIVGVSMGGMIAQEMAINYPERVTKLVLASTSPGRAMDDDTPSEILTTLGLLKEGSPAFDVGSLDSARVAHSLNSLAFNTWLYRRLISPLARIYIKWAAGGGIPGQFGAAVGHRALDRLHLIQAPTLVMTGAEDRILSPLSSEALASLIPNARLVKMQGGGHAIVAEMKSRFNREVLDFLSNG
jgi:3-oxoadipate enol-lactonase